MCGHLSRSLVGMRVNQVYHIDNKTYLFKFTKTANQSQTEEAVKQMLLIESGIRLHSTEYEWPKSNTPNGFTMKLRKHLKNKRLESIAQLGIDRVVDLTFGSNEAAYHVILELYDRGNIVITDYQYIILNILRPRKLGTDEDVKLVVKERYRIESAKTWQDFKPIDRKSLSLLFDNCKDGDNLKKILNPHLIFGAPLIEHSLIEFGLPLKLKKSELDLERLEKALNLCLTIMKDVSHSSKGYIIQKEEKRIGEPNASVISYLEFHPILMNQFKDSKDGTQSYLEIDSFDKAVDLFFSSIESQKIDAKALSQEKEAIKKLEKVKADHQKRLEELNRVQEEDIRKASLIESNNDIVEKALLVIRSAIANQYSWKEIEELIEEAKANNDPIASRIAGLKLDRNILTMKLNDPYDQSSDLISVDIDIGLSAFANARKYYDKRRTAAKKEQKTIESSTKAFKSAQRKAMQTLKEVAVKTSITKARKVMWFEKFFWFISSDNYLVIAGRDAQQNELIVKRYMNPHDVYVHADIHGATSVVVKNSDAPHPIPPKTLSEAGDMAICYSAAWDSKTVTSAFWVHPEQVSKTAPTGEYLTVGSFMIRGKKNFLPLSHLVMGFGFVFKLDDESTERHRSERKTTFAGESELTSATEDESVVEEEILCETDSEHEDEPRFPDTKPKLDIESHEESVQILQDENDQQSLTIVRSKEPRIKQNSQRNKQKNQNSNKKQENKTKSDTTTPSDKQGQPKRGQKSKLKKMKEKYKDQDEEERLLRMSILGKSLPKSDREEMVTDFQSNAEEENEKVKHSVEKVANHQSLSLNQVSKEEILEEENEPEDEEVTVGQSDEVKVIDTLTGCPLAEDILLFAIPVCGPYSAINGYKYKVKVLPGNNRRGKAAKTALSLFLKDKTATDRERDLLKAVKDQDISKNIPTKIKITASNLSAVKAKK